MAALNRREFLLTGSAAGVGLLLSDFGDFAVGASDHIGRCGRHRGHRMAVGVDITGNTSPGKTLHEVYRAHRRSFGGPLGGHTKFFSPDGIEHAYRKMRLAWAGVHDEHTPVLCFKSWDRAAFSAVMDKMTSDWVAVYYDGPEHDGAAGVHAAQPHVYRSVYAAMDEARRSHRHGRHVGLLKNLSRHREASGGGAKGYTWHQYDGGQRFERLLIGGDCYSPATRVHPLSSHELFGWLLDWHRASGLPFAVPEFAVASGLRGRRFPDADRAAVIARHLHFLERAGCRWVNYWCSGDTGNGDWRLEGTAALHTWRKAMRTHRRNS